MAIRFDKKYNAEIRKVVKNFNQKRNRAIKRGYHFLPPALTTSELKSRYETRAQLNRDLKLIRNFNTKGDAALRVIETSGGAKAIKWEYDYLKKNIQNAKDYYDRAIKEAARFDSETMVGKSEYLNNLRDKRAYLDLEMAQLNQSQFKTFRKTINEFLNANNSELKDYRNWMSEIEIIMRNLGYDNRTINRFFKGFDKLTPHEFLNMYRQSALVSRIYELYIPTKDRSFKLSTTEDDAKELIDTFMIEKDELIKKAKSPKKLSEKEANRLLKELDKQDLAERRAAAIEKLNRKDLTEEQIQALKELGWDDLIE